MLAEAMAGVDQPLDHVAIVDGRLTVLTAGRGKPAVYDGLRLTFDRSGVGRQGDPVGARPLGGMERRGARAKPAPKRKLSVEARELAVDDFLRLDPHPPAFSFDSPMSFQFAADDLARRVR